MTAEQQYLAILEDCLINGREVYNERTNSVCYTLLNQRIQFHIDDGFPLITTRKSYWKQAIGEMLGYIRGYTSTEQFHTLGVHTWDANAKNPIWANSFQGMCAKDKGMDLGIIYGASSEKTGVSFVNIIDKIKANPYDRGHIWNFWNPAYFDEGCLRPCMFNHQFNVVGNTIHLTSTQRSADLPLGTNFNIIQAWFLLYIVARLTGFQAGIVTINIANAHIYENQLEGVKEQISRNPYTPPKLRFKQTLSLEDILENIAKDNFDDYFELLHYKYHPAIKYPFTV